MTKDETESLIAEANRIGEHKEGDLRVWHVPQIGMKNEFFIEVPDVSTAAHLLVTLANYDLYLLKHNLRADYANVNGLEVFQDGEWQGWANEDGDDIVDHMIYAKVAS